MATLVTSKHGTRHFFSYYKKTRGKNIPITKIKEYTNVLKLFNTKVIDALIYDREEFQLPLGLGKMRINKKIRRIGKNPKGDTSFRRVNWAETRKLWREDDYARDNKKLVFADVDKDCMYYFHWLRSKGIRVKNVAKYNFKAAWHNRIKLSNNLNNNPLFDYV